MITVHIENLRGVRDLKFEVPEKKGVYLLAGTNGSGKTTLLTCLERICENMALRYGFSTSSNETPCDSAKQAVITYESDQGQKVIITKAAERWSPTPKNGSEIMRKLGFESTRFIQATPHRISYPQIEIRKGNLVSAPEEIKDAMQYIFDEDKFTHLKILTGGARKNKTHFNVFVIENDGIFYSEKNFSNGELAILRLVERFHFSNPDDKSLVLIDEAELALHPKAQHKLFQYLKKNAEEKNLVVICSTHSVTLLRNCEKENIILLQKEGKDITVVTPCYPALAIGVLDLSIYVMDDFMFFVEDTCAKLFLDKMIEFYHQKKREPATARHLTIPVGGYLETARMAERVQMKLGGTTVYAVLDQDAAGPEADQKSLASITNKYTHLIKFLPFTPEVFIIENVEKDDEGLRKLVKKHYKLELSEILESEEYKKCIKENLRHRAKDRFNCLLNYFNLKSGIDENLIKDRLFEYLINHCLKPQEIMTLVGSLMKKR